MQFDINLRIISAPDDGLLAVLNQLINGVKRMDAQIQQLVDKVQEQSGKVESMKTFIAGLEQRVNDALSGATLPPAVKAELDKVFDGLTQNTQSIADAIDNDPNTPPQQTEQPPANPDDPARVSAAQQQSRGGR